jgi:hypothetical protein
MNAKLYDAFGALRGRNAWAQESSLARDWIDPLVGV